MVAESVRSEQELGQASSVTCSTSFGLTPSEFARLKTDMRLVLTRLLSDSLYDEIGADILVCVGEVWANTVKHESSTGRAFTVMLSVEGRTLVCELEWGGDPESGWLEEARQAYRTRYQETKRYDRQDAPSAGLGILILDTIFQGGVTYRPVPVVDNRQTRIVGVLQMVYVLP